MKTANKTTSLIHGCEIISRKLGFFLSPMGLLFQFDSNEPRKAKPLPLSVVLLISCCFLSLLTWDYLIYIDYVGVTRNPEYTTASKSTFVVLMYKFFEFYRIFIHLAIYFIPIRHHGPITSVISQGNYIINDLEQEKISRSSFNVFLIRSVVLVSVIAALYGKNLGDLNDWRAYYTICICLYGFVLQLTSAGPFIYVCYLGSALGKHVSNFSDVHIEPLFDQFAIQQQQQLEWQDYNAKNGDLMDTQSQATSGPGRATSEITSNQQQQQHPQVSFWARIGNLPARFWSQMATIMKYLNAKGYPDFAGQSLDLNKSDTSSRISEKARIANTHLIRNRLRKTQIMLSELRDTVNDINKMSSLLVMGLILNDSIILVLVTTASIQAKVYKSISLLIIPTIAYTISSTITVVYISLCLDETTSQLKLMINKLFDFIIMNLRVKLDGPNATIGNNDPDNSNDNNNRDSSAQNHLDQQLDPDDLRKLLVGSNSAMAPIKTLEDLYDREDEVQSETWFQFQYTRKLASTIHFRMGGILAISRRLVLPTLAHILSFVFISIEIMSIIDTLGQESSPSSSTNHNNPVHHQSVGNMDATNIHLTGLHNKSMLLHAHS